LAGPGMLTFMSTQGAPAGCSERPVVGDGRGALSHQIGHFESTFGPERGIFGRELGQKGSFGAFPTHKSSRPTLPQSAGMGKETLG